MCETLAVCQSLLNPCHLEMEAERASEMSPFYMFILHGSWLENHDISNINSRLFFI